MDASRVASLRRAVKVVEAAFTLADTIVTFSVTAAHFAGDGCWAHLGAAVCAAVTRRALTKAILANAMSRTFVGAPLNAAVLACI